MVDLIQWSSNQINYIEKYRFPTSSVSGQYLEVEDYIEKFLKSFSKQASKVISYGEDSKLEKLEGYTAEAKKINDIAKSAKFSRDKIFACLEDMRVTIDELERTVSKKYWKLPTYGDMLYSLS